MVLCREGVGGVHGSAGGMIPNQVVVLKEHLPACLPAREALRLLEVGQVFMICKGHYRVGGAGQVLAPFG